jgi:hypothetical protein
VELGVVLVADSVVEPFAQIVVGFTKAVAIGGGTNVKGSLATVEPHSLVTASCTLWLVKELKLTTGLIAVLDDGLPVVCHK